MVLLYILLNAIALGLTFFTQQQLQRFLQHHQSIADFKSLAEFKAIARSNMYLALAQFGLLGSSLVLGLYLLHLYKFPMLLLILAVNGVVYFISQNLKTLEVRSRGLECATPELTNIYKKVSEVWLTKPFPNF